MKIDRAGRLIFPPPDSRDPAVVSDELCSSLAPLLLRTLAVIHVGATDVGLDRVVIVSLRESRTSETRFLAGVGRARETEVAVYNAVFDALALRDEPVVLLGALGGLIEDGEVSTAVVVDEGIEHCLGETDDAPRLVALARSLSARSQLAVCSSEARYRAIDLGTVRFAMRIAGGRPTTRVDGWLERISAARGQPGADLGLR